MPVSFKLQAHVGDKSVRKDYLALSAVMHTVQCIDSAKAAVSVVPGDGNKWKLSVSPVQEGQLQ